MDLSPRALIASGAVLLALAGTGLAATASTALAATSPGPTATATCPMGQTATHLVTAPVPALATRNAPAVRASGVMSTRPDGAIDRFVCLSPAPAPLPAPVVAPEHVVGGPRLATAGVVTDRPAGVPAPPDTAHASYLVADFDTGAVLAAKNPHARFYPASTLKALTALVVIPALPEDQVVIGADEDTRAEGTRVGMTVGGSYTVGDLLNGLILISGNDTAYALGRAYGGRPKLIAAMNSTARELGAWDTTAVDPSGLDAPGQHSSAYDLALIGRAVMGLAGYRSRAVLPATSFPGGLVPASAPAVRTGSATKPSAELVPGPAFQIDNHNQLLGVYPGVLGVKNGHTTLARNTYIGLVRVGGRTLLVTTMGSPEPQAPSTAALLDWAFAYAGRLRPVGSLVAPGTAAQPPELAAESGTRMTSSTGPVTTTAISTAASTGEPSGVESAAAAAALSGASTVVAQWPLLAAASTWWGSLPDLARWLTEALGLGGVAAAGWWVTRRARRRRGAFQR